MASNPYARHNEESKASFDHVYDLPDPRGYFRALGALDYRAPEHGGRLFPTLLRQIQEIPGTGLPSGVLDLCCSYGVNAALLRHDLALEDLYARYASPELAEFSADELAEDDRAFYAAHRQASRPAVVGADAATNAVAYAMSAGLLREGFGENFETAEPSGAFGEAVGDVGLVTVTGGVGYVWASTFDRVLSSVTRAREASAGAAPWIATLPARIVDYRPLSDLFSRYGLVTEKLSSRTFPQRRFSDAAEREHVLRTLEGMGLDPSGKEQEGYYHADLYLSRPAKESSGVSVDELFAAAGVLDY